MSIYAIIDTVSEGHTMGKKRLKKKEKNTVKTKSIYDKNGLFHTTEQTQGKVIQTTNVHVVVNPEKEGCWDGIKACFGFGSRVARTAS